MPLRLSYCPAAVADYRPLRIDRHKNKKQDGSLTLELTKTVDITQHNWVVAKGWTNHRWLCPLRQNKKTNAEKKLVSKNFDLIVLIPSTIPEPVLVTIPIRLKSLSRGGSSVVVPQSQNRGRGRHRPETIIRIACVGLAHRIASGAIGNCPWAGTQLQGDH